jgi:hypothetical protein
MKPQIRKENTKMKKTINAHRITKTRPLPAEVGIEYYCPSCKEWLHESDGFRCETCGVFVCDEENIDQPYGDIDICAKCARETYEYREKKMKAKK